MGGYGGNIPDISYGLEITVEPPAGTSDAAPVLAGDIFKLGGTAYDGTGYKAAAATAADVPASGDTGTSATGVGVVLLMAKHRETDPKGNLGVKVLGHFQTVRRLRYEGTAPTVGQSIAISSGSSQRRVTGVAFDGRSYILAVLPATSEVEVLI